MRLTGGAAGARVELVRCQDCGAGVWHLDGARVAKARALAELAAAFRPAAPRRRRVASAATPPSSIPADPPPAARPSAAVLLAGWQVFGTTS